MGLVLVVDDSRETLYMLQSFLRRWGHEVLTAETEEAALALLVDHHPDLLIVDGMMPGLNGVEFIRLLRANEETALVPAILYTALSQGEFTQNALDKGANEIWIKGQVEYEQMRVAMTQFASPVRPLHLPHRMCPSTGPRFFWQPPRFPSTLLPKPLR